MYLISLVFIKQEQSSATYKTLEFTQNYQGPYESQIQP